MTVGISDSFNWTIIKKSNCNSFCWGNPEKLHEKKSTNALITLRSILSSQRSVEVFPKKSANWKVISQVSDWMIIYTAIMFNSIPEFSGLSVLFTFEVTYKCSWSSNTFSELFFSIYITKKIVDSTLINRSNELWTMVFQKWKTQKNRKCPIKNHHIYMVLAKT